jgi:hypothetical protein
VLKWILLRKSAEIMHLIIDTNLPPTSSTVQQISHPTGGDNNKGLMGFGYD